MSVLTPTRAGAISGADTYVKILLHGKSGAGKSRIGSTMPKPAILLLEANGLPTIRRANPDAVVFLAYDPGQYGLTSPFEVVAEFVRMGMSGELRALGCESSVVDSATEVQRVIRDQILRELGQLDNRGYQFTQQNWGTLTERMRRFMRTFRDFPMHCLAITLTNEDKDENEVVSLIPSFEGRKLPGEVAQFFSAVGYAFKREAKIEEEGKPTRTVVEHRVLFQGGSKYLVKPCEPLRNVELPDATDWIARITADAAGPGSARVPLDVTPTPTDAPAVAPAATAALTKPSSSAPNGNGERTKPVTTTTTTTRRSRVARPEADPAA